LVACTNGGIPTSSGGGTGTEIVVNLALFMLSQTPYGTSRGYSPPITNVAVGSQIFFMNTDNTQHTATLVPNATKFPPIPPFTRTALQQSGNNVSGGFSSGVLEPGSSSQTITADRAGTYLFGCFFHYAGGMRAAIVAH
jgi:plastocyanin